MRPGTDCPACEGSGYDPLFVGRDADDEPPACPTCNGSGLAAEPIEPTGFDLRSNDVRPPRSVPESHAEQSIRNEYYDLGFEDGMAACGSGHSDALTAPDEPSAGLDVGRLVRQWESHAHFLEDAADATADRKHAAALRGEARGVDWARRILFARYSIEREARAASASVPPFGASKANPFTKKIDVVADTPEQGK